MPNKTVLISKEKIKKRKKQMKIYGTECKCGHRIGVHFVAIKGISDEGAKDKCEGYTRKSQPNYDGKLCNCKKYERKEKW